MRGASLANAVCWLGLSAWAAALGAAALSAASVFGRLGGMELHLERFAALPAAEHGTLAAGLVMADVFRTADVVRFVAVPLVIAAVGFQLPGLRREPWRPASLIRVCSLLLAAALFAWYAAGVAPRLDRQVRAYWALAESGDVDSAHAAREALRPLHARAEAIQSAELVLVTVAVAASAAAFTQPAGRP